MTGPLSDAELVELVAYATSDPAPTPSAPPALPDMGLEALLAAVDLPPPKRRGPGVIWLTRDAFKALPEYSLTDPTELVPGKRWKRDANMTWTGPRGRPSWWLCEYLLRGREAVITSKKILIEWDLEIAAEYVEYRRAQRRAKSLGVAAPAPAVEEVHE